MRSLSRLRFDALAGYVRGPLATFHAEEVSWFEHGAERVLGTVLRDRTDDDFTGVVLGRDRRGRFRAVHLTSTETSRRRAQLVLRRDMERLAMAPDEEYYQGDEKGGPVDFFAPRVTRERLHPYFVTLAETEAYSPARGVVAAMMHWYEDPDGNFIEQFQTTGFDARIWELYLFAAFVEMGYRINRIHAVPDFVCDGLRGEFAVEATTVNPTQDASGNTVPLPPHGTPDERRALVREYMPIKFGSALTSKLSKRYWERPSAANKPLVFAIQDFSTPTSMIFTRSALPIYLYGHDWDWERDAAGHLKIKPRKVATHQWAGKKIPSGFFDLPDAENVSAVLFSNSGTIAKFNRMGFLAEFGSKRLVMLRDGFVYDPNPDAADPREFHHVVGYAGYTETWVEGLDVFHNPRSKYPLDPWSIPGAAHHRLLEDRLLQSFTPGWHPVGSVTRIFVLPTEEEARRVVETAQGEAEHVARGAEDVH